MEDARASYTSLRDNDQPAEASMLAAHVHTSVMQLKKKKKKKTEEDENTYHTLIEEQRAERGKVVERKTDTRAESARAVTPIERHGAFLRAQTHFEKRRGHEQYTVQRPLCVGLAHVFTILVLCLPVWMWLASLQG
jgi:hypothetical protein